MNKRTTFGLALIVIGLVGILVVAAVGFYGNRYWPMGPGMMRYESWGYQQKQSAPLTMEQAESTAKIYADSLNNPNLAVKEIMEFEQNFYVIYYEQSTGIGAFEMLIWKVTSSGMMGPGMMGGMVVGQITPEPGPNMMWNTKYGGMMEHMGGGMMDGGMMDGGMMDGGMMGGSPYGEVTADMPIDEGEAIDIGREYLDDYFSGSTIIESTKFYGYYTFDFGKDSKIIGMFSVNGYTGQTWYHGWHGEFIGMEEYYEHHED